ncbi:MAG TPA: DUF3352 domain-containing protein [Baekduia sp.]|nr:DUF3352 domain-containing protein [Baekduia sp.]
MRSRTLLSLFVTLLAALALTACGGSDSDKKSDSSGASVDLNGPASLAPADSPLYFEATVDPNGYNATEIKDVVSKVSRGKVTDPGTEIIKALEKSSREGSDPKPVDFAKDVEPWLGDRGGLFVSSFGELSSRATQGAGSSELLSGGDVPKPLSSDEADFDGAFVVEVTDTAKAQAFIDKTVAKNATTKDYSGTKYKLEPDASDTAAVGIVGDFLVFGSEAGLKKAVDTSKGSSLAENDAFKKTVAATTGKLGFGYVSSAGLKKALSANASAGTGQAETLEAAFGQFDSIGFGVDVRSDAVSIDAVSIGGEATSGDPGALVGEVPADAVLAAGTADIGANSKKFFDQIDKLDDTGQFRTGLDQLESIGGLSLEKDVLAWMGDGAIFVRGSSLSDVGGAIIIKSKDAAKTKATIAKLKQLTSLAAAGGESSAIQVAPIAGAQVDDGFSVRSPQLPFPVEIALKGDRFVIAIGNGALADSLAPKEKLSSTDAFKSAADQLVDGTELSFFLDVPKIVDAISTVAGNSPDFREAKPYLDAFGQVAGGTKRTKDGQAQNLVIGIEK